MAIFAVPWCCGLNVLWSSSKEKMEGGYKQSSHVETNTGRGERAELQNGGAKLWISPPPRAFGWFFPFSTELEHNFAVHLTWKDVQNDCVTLLLLCKHNIGKRGGVGWQHGDVACKQHSHLLPCCLLQLPPQAGALPPLWGSSVLFFSQG